MSTPSKRRSRLIVASPYAAPSRRRSVRVSVGKPVKSNIKVCIRVRPSNEKELGFLEGKSIVEFIDQNILVFDPVEIHTPSFHRGRPTRDPTAKRNRNIKFAFGHVFGPSSTNEDVFNETTNEILDNLMNGVNCSVFAYGATGAGKTFTMLGTPTNKGVIARTVDALYERIEAIRSSTLCEVEVSYLEIYNETVRDLLTPTGNELILRESGEGVAVAGLTFHKPANVDELFQMLEKGNGNRTQHPTDANKESSRSHAVFHIYLKQKDSTSELSTNIVMSKMALIDLAGSERASATANCGARFREGANINRSLLALGNCINALAEGKKANHIPYRDSKLTRILKDSLGGNCQTVMIAAISPSAITYDDTYNTLKYADRAQKIKLELRSNVYRVDRHGSQYDKLLEQLQSEVQELRAHVGSLQKENKKLKQQLDTNNQPVQSIVSRPIEVDGTPAMKSNIASAMMPQEKIAGLSEAVERYTQAQKSLLEFQSQKGVLQLKGQHREHSHHQLAEVQWDIQKKNSMKHRFEKFQNNCQTRIEQLDSQVARAEDLLRISKTHLDGILRREGFQPLENNGNMVDAQGSPAKKRFLQWALGRSELCQQQASDKHLKAVIECLNSRLDQQDRVIEGIGPLAKEMYLLLQSYDHLSPSLVSRYESMEKLLEGTKEVSWSDQNGNGESNSAQIFTLPDHSVRASAKRKLPPSSRDQSNSYASAGTSSVGHRLKRQAISTKNLRQWHY